MIRIKITINESLSIYLPNYTSFYISVFRTIHLSIYPYLYLSISLSIHFFILQFLYHPSISAFIYQTYINISWCRIRSRCGYNITTGKPIESRRALAEKSSRLIQAGSTILTDSSSTMVQFNFTVGTRVTGTRTVAHKSTWTKIKNIISL